MKKLFFITILFIYFLINYQSEATTPCPVDNCTAPWIEDRNPILVDTNGCSALIYFKYRECPETPPPPIPNRQIEIKEIVLINGGNCDNTSDAMIINKAVKSILALSFGIYSGYVSEYNLKIKMPSCVKRTPSTEYPGATSISNNNCSSGCCEVTYHVGHDLGNTKVLEPPTYSSNTNTCTDVIGESCTKYCDLMYDVPVNTPLYPYSYIPSLQNSGCITSYCNGGGYTTEIRSSTYNIEPNGLNYTVWYKYIQCNAENNPQVYVVIERIQILRNVNYPTYEYVRHAYTHVFRKLRQDGILSADDQFLRAITPVCWQAIYDNNNIKIAIHPCAFEECCYRDIRIWIVDGDYKIRDNKPPVINGQNVQCGTCNNYCCSNPSTCLVSEFTPNIGRLPKISISESFNSELSLYPNPSNDKIVFELKNNYMGKLKFVIYDIKGNLLSDVDKSKNNIDFQYQLDVSNYQNGIYFYRIVIGDNYLSGRFVIEK